MNSVILFLLLILPAISYGSVNHEFLKLNDSNNKIEIYWDKPEGVGPWPLLILLHPHQEWPDKIGSEVFVKNKSIEAWTKNNFVTVAISMPGYGNTDGISDFCGPQSQKAVEDVITYFVNK